jgi:flagellar basal-body rod protein FlgB
MGVRTEQGRLGSERHGRAPTTSAGRRGDTAPGEGGGDVLDFTMRAIRAELAGLSARQRIIAQNLANSETPGYLAGRVEFEDSLRSALGNGAPEATQVSTTNSLAATGMNGNNVNVDEENVSLIETGLRYQLATEAMNVKFRILRESIKQG